MNRVFSGTLVGLALLCAASANGAEIRVSPRHLNGDAIEQLAGARFFTQVTGGGRLLIAEMVNGQVRNASNGISITFDGSDPNNPMFVIRIDEALFPATIGNQPNGAKTDVALSMSFQLTVGNDVRIPPPPLNSVMPRGNQRYILAFPERKNAPCWTYRAPRCCLGR
jgi:hypothetical protein